MSEALNILAELDLQHRKRKTPNFPDYARVRTKFSDRTANGLTKCILRFLQLTGNHAERINTTGRPIDRTRVTTDCLGRKQRIGSIEWLPTTGMKGSADIHSIIDGRFVAVEIKMKDRQSEAQKKYQARVEEAGGLYWIIRSFEQFMNQYENLKGQ